MSSSTKKECTICEDELNETDDLVTTNCNHTFHRHCAQDRLDTKNKSDCYVCRQESALGEALSRLKIISKGECSICEGLWTLKDDLIITDCNHTFHYDCAQDRLNKKKRTDCHVCHKDSALGNALALKNSIRKGECSICEEELNWKDDIVTTNCNHTFHRRCAQDRLDKKNKTDCRFCHQPSAFDNILFPNTTTTTTKKPTETKLETITTGMNTPQRVDLAAKAKNTTEENEDNWRCDECSNTNEATTTRCGFCAKPRFPVQSSISTVQTQRQDEITNEYNPIALSNKHLKNDEYNSFDSRMSDFMDIDPPQIIKSSSASNTAYSLRSNTPSTISKQGFSTIESNDDEYSSTSQAIVYIFDLPSNIENDLYLEHVIQIRLQKTSQITPISIKCYPKLGAGFMYVRNKQIKNRLVQDIQRMTLDSTKDSSISFNDKIELISYVVIDKPNEKVNVNLPKPNEILNRWIELYHGDKNCLCEQISIQFPNIYRIISTSFDDLLNVMLNPDFLINNLFAHVYIGADCSFFEDLPKSTKKEQLEKAICDSIGMKNISSSSIHIELNTQTNTACIITTDQARNWATQSFLSLGDRAISKKATLTCRLLLHPISEHYENDEILNHIIFRGQAKLLERRGENLVLQISNKNIYDNCLTVGVLSIKDKPRLKMEVYTAFTNPEDRDIDAETWYQYEMIRYKPDIMQFIADFDHPIFRYKWNSEIWLQQFQNSKSQNRVTNVNSRYPSNLSSDQIRHLLQMTVMLNTIGVIRKKSYLLNNNNQIELNLDSQLKTIVYNHESLLEHSRSIRFPTTPYTETKVDVINDDCINVYEDCIRRYKKPLLLNMASATSPGGGYRKGDGAQEENLFRRSDYFRSLDIDLDQIQEQIPERYYCSHNGQISSFDNQIMYPIDEYGAIYTSGLTFFRKSEDKGYAFMEQPLNDVCSLAIAAYRNPKLDENNMLSPKYAVGMRKKIENLFSIAYHHKHDCLILSAFGCGAFKNPPDHVAKLFRSVIEQYAGFFQRIIFAIIDDHNTGQQHNRQGNLQSFKDELDRHIFRPILSLNYPNTIIGPYRISSDGLSINDVIIFDLQPCHFGAKCNEIYDLKHAQNFSHPTLCKQKCLDGTCNQTDNLIHMLSFIHRNPCKYGVQCRDIDNEKHAQEYEHPSYCPIGGSCQNTSDEHEKLYRHLPLCEQFQKCLDYKRHDKNHCEKFRHYMPRCNHGSNCVKFHDKQHIEDYIHPFPPPCPFTPYHCQIYEKLIMAKDPGKLTHDIQQHYLNFAHVCSFGRNCTSKDSLHWEILIHVPRSCCPYGNQCAKLLQEDHLNSFTHPNIRDIRFLCKHAEMCYDRHNLKHLSKFRHIITFEDSGVVRYFNLNKDIDFVQNQQGNIERVIRYITKEKWKTLTSGIIPQNIIDWIRTVQPVHRCKRDIFESILLHGHVMSLHYMQQLAFEENVAMSVFQHSQIRRILRLKGNQCIEHVRKYIKALVTEKFKQNRYENMNTLSLEMNNSKSGKQLIDSKEVFLSESLSQSDIDTIKTKATEIAQASIELQSKLPGCHCESDQKLGTNKNVFSILGPHLGHYYGDIFIVFKREILHHPDSNFSIQSATSYASKRAFKWRPWLDNDPNSNTDGIKLFHETKLHASITGYEYATALELIAMMSYSLKKKSMNIDLKTILDHWLTRDSHMNIEAHLPQLIPLDYIDHIYMSQNTFDALNSNARRFIDSTFKNRITKTLHEIELDLDHDIPFVFGPKPNSDIRTEYQDFVIKDIIKKYGQRDIHFISRPIQGIVITIPSSEFTDPYVLPITISQAYKQYKIDHQQASIDITVYIYWQVMNGDMMLTLSNEQINTGEKQPNLRCLMCYIAEKPSTKDGHYNENISYLYNGRPFRHESVLKEQKYEAKSRSFYKGCNTDDFMTFCLEIQRSTGKVILSHSGPNSIYNHEQISAKFSKSNLDLNQLNFIHVSAGARTIPIRNIFVTFEKQSDLHPTVNEKFEKGLPSSPDIQNDTNHNVPSSGTPDTKDKKAPGFFHQMKDVAIQAKNKMKDLFIGGDSSSLTPCPESIYCLIQFSDEGSTHNSTYSHPCRFSELCRDQEPHLTHEPHQVSQCNAGRTCKDLCNPIHRAQYRHSGWPDFLIPCRNQQNCRDHSDKHRIKYSHGERVLELINNTIIQTSSSTHSIQSYNPSKTCKWGSKCRQILDSEHCKQYSHPSV